MILVNPVFRQAPSRNNTWFRRMNEATEKDWRDGLALLSSCSRSKMDAYDKLVYYRHYHHYHHFHHYYYYCWPEHTSRQRSLPSLQLLSCSL